MNIDELDINGDFPSIFPGHQLPGAAALSRSGDPGLGPLSQRRLLRHRRAAAGDDPADPGEA